MLMNNLDPEVAEDPDRLVVYGGSGKAARNWDCFEAICKTLKEMAPDETLLVQSGKPVGVAKPTPTLHGFSSPTPIWSRVGERFRSSVASRLKA